MQADVFFSRGVFKSMDNKHIYILGTRYRHTHTYIIYIYMYRIHF